MASRNAIEVYDPEMVARQVQLEVRQKMKERGEPRQHIAPDAPIFKIFADIAAKEAHKFEQREDERRRRDPTYRPDALDFTNEPTRAFDRTIDYYKRLGLDQFASSNEIKRAYMKLSLLYHPDKQVGKTKAEVERAIEEFKRLTESYEILSDQPTRRQYDRERDKRSAMKDQYGFDSDDQNTKNPPTCEEFIVTLEQLFRGSIHTVRFEQRSWEHWSKTYSTAWHTYALKINRGMLEGSTFWYKREGHQDQGKARSDLVFVLRQSSHARFERIGDDLWYYVRESAIAATQLLFVQRVPTIDERTAVAVGNTLGALLGFDRSCVGEAVVEGCGMPLRDEPGGRTRSTTPPAVAASVAVAASGHDAAVERTRGDLIVKFAITPCLPRRVEVVGGGVATPPVALVTSGDGRGGAMDPMALHTLLEHTLVPNVLLLAHRKWMRARAIATAPVASDTNARIARAVEAGADAEVATTVTQAADEVAARQRREAACFHASQALCGVYVRVGSLHADDQPSDCARAIMEAATRRLPQLTWRNVQMVRGGAHASSAELSEPLLADEEAAVEHAAVVVLEVAPDDSNVEAAAATPVEYTPATVATASSPHDSPSVPHTYRVVWPPGVRVRASPSFGAPVVGVLRHGEQLTASGPNDSGWVRCTLPSGSSTSKRGDAAWILARHGAAVLLHNESAMGADAVDEGFAVQTTESKASALSAMHAASAAAAGAQAQAAAHAAAHAAYPTAETAAAVEAARGAAREATAVALSANEAIELAAEAEEDESVDEEIARFSDKELAARDGAYMSGGCQAAIRLMATEGAKALYRCHCAGGLLIGVDRGCLLLSRRPSFLGARVKRSVHVAPGESKDVRDAAMREVEAAKRDLAAQVPSQWPELLPFAIGLAASSLPTDETAATNRAAWRRLRGGVLRGGVLNCSLGMCALGLPHGSAIVALSDRRFAPRSVLGSAQPLKLSRATLDEAEARRSVRLARRKRDKKRLQKLAELAAAGAEREESQRSPASDFQGVCRGQCEACMGCATGWVLPHFVQNLGHPLMMYCLGCGCAAWEHATLGS